MAMWAREVIKGPKVILFFFSFSNYMRKQNIEIVIDPWHAWLGNLAQDNCHKEPHCNNIA